MSSQTLPTICLSYLLNALTFIVFLFMDFLDVILCFVFKFLDKVLEGQTTSCYCGNHTDQELDHELSESLHKRRNVFSKIISPLLYSKKFNNQSAVKNRWSDCNCETCLSWMKYDRERLHVVVKEPDSLGCGNEKAENVIFIHGFLCSSSFWTQSVFKNLSETANKSYRLFAIDLLGFGKSPKPLDCQYTLNDHLEMIEKSVINPYELKSFHIVAHSMGGPIALALAAKYSDYIKSVTLVAPACFSCTENETAVDVLGKLAKKKLWPPESFQRSIMANYEHLGRSICFLVCRNHLTWEKLIKLVTRKRELNFAIKDLTKHTSHSAWHNVHNVICGGAKFLNGYLEILKNAGTKICLIHGDRDETTPLECSYYIKKKIPHANLTIIPKATHSSVIFRRKKEYTQSLENIWASN